jgi:phosphate/sulfate permease
MPIDPTFPLALLVMLVALALVFDFMNGFHDAANSIATVVSTGVLRQLPCTWFCALCPSPSARPPQPLASK